MRADKFDQIISDIPVYDAVFRITRVPDWLSKHGVTRGELFLVMKIDSWTMVRIRDGHRFTLVASSLEFVEYRKRAYATA